jgi:hypothetical protein
MSMLTVDVFRKGGKPLIINFFRAGRLLPSFFYYLAAALLSNYNNPVLGLILKPVVEL